ncbi:hypothetical protein AZF37_00395 [endosymbiont 'TC1' of Trimyema compressum]|uniref:SDR family NAD(P)-dependent oxidoreductase n=1 Tax=endosymbiont 'TC1' of Trimyema compressum TaxID=243899 RepID=UPI0007F15AAB|nr:SDR family NAD(P)-dependent oxidoreductase [endosymbiont 'TC1' of Trimyema compressum]AMP19840.1 hypothetical protein AZF37_00395 [endosymbiont 'TC1' of Trimyema compressum]
MKKVILLTGGTKGIGNAILNQLIKKTSYYIGFTYLNSNVIAKEISNQYQDRVLPYQSDLQDSHANKHFLAAVLKKWGQIDGLINNASISLEGLLETTPVKAIKNCLATNIEGSLILTKDTIPYLRQSCNKPFILNISSIWGAKGASCETVYAMTKGALNQMTTSLGKELGPCHIRTMGIAPGYINTDMTASYSQEDIIEFLKEVPLKRIGKPDEVAELAVFMMEKGTYLNGLTVSIDGGYGI